MKPSNFLWLPVLATLTDFLIALLYLPHLAAQSQPLSYDSIATTGRREASTSLKMDEVQVSHDGAPVDTPNQDVLSLMPQIQEEKDPMLMKMPGLDFEAYLRADIASFYRKEPGTVQEIAPKFNGQAGKFINMSPEPMGLYWVGPSGRSPISNQVPAFASGGTATFPGHEFVFVNPRKPQEPVCTFSIRAGTSVYYYDPFSVPEDDQEFDPARCVPPQGTKALELDILTPEYREKYRANKFNLAFGALYKNITGGQEWLSMYPRSKPRHPMWRADYFGQEHTVETRETHFHTDPGVSLTRNHRLTMDEMRRNTSSPIDLAEYRDPGPMNLTLKTLSCAPRALEIRNFLSGVEVDHLLHLVEQMNMQRSTTGDSGQGHVHTTRTSTNTWVPRNSDLLLNSVYRRAADVLRIDEALFRRRATDEIPELEFKNPINEDMQIVHYSVGQEYTAHHDFSYPNGKHPDSPSRSINLCMYLNDVEEGGETSFPRWRNAETGEAIKVKPEKGKAMIFYMVNPDGNLDDLTQHAAMPVIKGEKYFLNLWIHDPVRL